MGTPLGNGDSARGVRVLGGRSGKGDFLGEKEKIQKQKQKLFIILLIDRVRGEEYRNGNGENRRQGKNKEVIILE